MSDALSELSFERALEELEGAVQRLEEGDLTLEEAIALYEQGMRLAARCSDALDSAELQIQELAVMGDQPQAGMFFEEKGE
jgi:exodeoxyribonuclease VII small subunit